MTFAPLIILAVWIGLYPAPFLRRLETSVQHIVARVEPAVRGETAADCDDAGAEPRWPPPRTTRPRSSCESLPVRTPLTGTSPAPAPTSGADGAGQRR